MADIEFWKELANRAVQPEKELAVKYGCAFPRRPPVNESSGVYAYAAPMMDNDGWLPPAGIGPWPSPPTGNEILVPSEPNLNPEVFAVDAKGLLRDLIDTIAKLKTQNAEIYRLKALALEIKERVDEQS